MLKTLLCASLLASTSLSASAETLYFYNFSEYVPPSLLEAFEEETGIEVIYTTYESNEAMYAKLKTVGKGYDIVVPSTYFVAKMRREGMLMPIDTNRLTNYHHLDANFLGRDYDPDNQYTVPYMWGATGIGVNQAMLPDANINAWADLWHPEYQGKVMLLDDARSVFHLGLRKLGYSTNSVDEQEIKQAYEELRKLIPSVVVFNSDFPAAPFMAGEVDLGAIWNGSAYMARQEGTPVDVVWPKEGAILWMDVLTIPAGAENVEAAHKMIDFLIRPDNAAKIALEIGYLTPVKTAQAMLPQSLKDDPAVYPPQEVLDNGHWQDDVGEMSALYESLYLRLKAGQ
ncbi:extracellular solute-binding protein [Thaumasiovibrio subtropicus]|uniref:extracellular solute-binding protein n=1 Tax=Thaumasiovibrio subtropicus TaxID=1891207 RepID=UPI000B35DAD5|nr:extracellular solute-binding protein [Thaumasiovibrio subtropicus]